MTWKDFCSAIRDQLSCGSCTAMGTLGAWEALLRINGEDVDLSERDLFSCSGGQCSIGNTMEKTLDRALVGVCLEECCPYDARDHRCGDGRCSEWWQTGKRLGSWEAVTSIEEMKALLEEGPLVGVMAVHQSFLNYQSGIYHSLGFFDPVVGYHCISVVGENVEYDAWLLRNSWGTDWGMEGYCYIKKGDSEINQIMYRLVLDGEIEPEPTPSPCPWGNLAARVLNVVPYLLGRRGRFYYRNPL